MIVTSKEYRAERTTTGELLVVILLQEVIIMNSDMCEGCECHTCKFVDCIAALCGFCYEGKYKIHGCSEYVERAEEQE